MNSYEELLGALEKGAIDSNCGFVKLTGPLLERFQRHDNGGISFDCLLHMQEWRARADQVHILIHVQETIRGQKPNYILERSNVRVNYFKVKDGQAHLLQSIHFDHGPEELTHPIFHAQLTNEPVLMSSEAATELEFDFPQVPCSACFKNARIPTSDMTLPSVLLCLAADHFGPEFFTGFFEQVSELQRKLPQPKFEKMKASLQNNPEHLRSSHWFAHIVKDVEDRQQRLALNDNSK